KHVFVPTPSGGVQTVLVHDGNAKQVALVRSHLRKEATAFARGDFADPASIHGGDMPGLKAMHAGSARISVRYADVPNGARITYATADPELVSAIHAWFKAQVSDHGPHATMKM
nr:aspartate carbamoyltransferase [Candidatus Eremiobacteraeota bacterium]